MDLFDSTGKPPPQEAPVQQSSAHLESSRFPSPLENLWIEGRVAEPQRLQSLPEPILNETTPPPPTVSLVSSPPTPMADPQVIPPATNIPRSLPPPELRQLTSSKIPSSRIGRLFHYGGESLHVQRADHSSDIVTGLAASLGYGAASEILRRSVSSEESPQNGGSLMLTESNVKRLVTKLTKMRGAALKLGQFMSIQGKRVVFLLLRKAHALF